MSKYLVVTHQTALSPDLQRGFQAFGPYQTAPVPGMLSPRGSHSRARVEVGSDDQL